jgi:hypothetical protein
VERSFPVSLTGPYARVVNCPRSIPWGMIVPHASFAHVLFGQPLEVLASHGGLTPCALWALMHGHGLLGSIGPDVPGRMVAWLSGLVEGWMASGKSSPADPEPPVVSVSEGPSETVVRVGSAEVSFPED